MEHFKEMKMIAKKFGVALKFQETYHPHFNAYDQYISINSDSCLSTFFHELGHFVDMKNGKYKTYYDYRKKSRTKLFRKIMLNAEYHADKTGKKLMKKYFPDLTYRPGYPKSKHNWNLKFLNEHWDGLYGK